MGTGDTTFPREPSERKRHRPTPPARPPAGRLLTFERPQSASSLPPKTGNNGRWLVAGAAGALALLSGFLFSVLPRPPIDSRLLTRDVSPTLSPTTPGLPLALAHPPLNLIEVRRGRAREFRLGVDLLDLYFNRTRAARGEAGAAARELSALADEPWATLYQRAAHRIETRQEDEALLGTELAAAEHSQTARRPVAICFGRWAEAARLATIAGSTAFFSSPETLPTLRWLLDQKDVALDAATVRALWTLTRRLENGPLSPPELPLLRAELEQLVARN